MRVGAIATCKQEYHTQAEAITAAHLCIPTRIRTHTRAGGQAHYNAVDHAAANSHAHRHTQIALRPRAATNADANIHMQIAHTRKKQPKPLGAIW